jgi:hypothetical protein
MLEGKRHMSHARERLAARKYGGGVYEGASAVTNGDMSSPHLAPPRWGSREVFRRLDVDTPELPEVWYWQFTTGQSENIDALMRSAGGT